MNFSTIKNLDHLILRYASVDIDDILEILSACKNPHHVVTYQWFRELLRRNLGSEDITVPEFFEMAEEKLDGSPEALWNTFMDIKAKVMAGAPGEDIDDANHYETSEPGPQIHIDRFDGGGGGASGTGSSMLGRM